MPALAVVPAPVSMKPGAGAPFRLDSQVRLEGDPDAAAALSALVAARTGLTLGGSDGAAMAPRVNLALGSGDAPESYRITADAASVVVTGGDAAGLFYGIQTLGQLIAPDAGDWVVPAVEIEDSPRFSYRGVMLDVARHFHPVDTVKAYIDRAAGLKFNALHLHLTDDQGWRIHLDSRPKLSEVASRTAVGGDAGGFYSKADYREIVEYAASRHMVLVPEIDMPGHTHAVGLAYPELAEAPVLNEHIHEVVRVYGGELPAEGAPYEGLAVGFSSLRIDDEATYDFVADVFGELAAMTPGPFVHLGGDEALGTDPADFARFVARASRIIADLGKTPVAWHEAGAVPDIASSTIGQYWGFVTPTGGMDDHARTFVRNGSKLILSPADAVYLDMQYPAGPSLGLTWANGPTSIERAYAWEPTAVIGGIEEKDILGVEAALWTETIRTLDDIDVMAFPRAAAAAEVGWSPAAGELRTWGSFRERVGALAPLWTSLGIGFHPSSEIPWAAE